VINFCSPSPFFADLITEIPENSQLSNQNLAEQLKGLGKQEGKQKLITHICSQVAKVMGLNDQETIDVNCNWSELGLDSLMTIELRSNLQSSLDCSLSSMALLDYPTVTALGEYLAEEVLRWDSPKEQQAETEKRSPLTVVTLQDQGSQSPLFLVSGILGSVFDLYPLSRHLGKERPVYGLRSLGLEVGEKPLTTISEIATYHIEGIKQIQQSGPYWLGGHSFGGKVVFEIAQQLRHQGEQVALLAIMDIPVEVIQAEQNALHWNDTQYLVNLAKIYALIMGKPFIISQNLDQKLTLDEQLTDLSEQLANAGQNLSVEDLSQIFQVYKSNMMADTQYRPQERYPIPINFIRSQELGIADFVPDAIATANDPHWGWSQISAKDVTLYTVSGNHFTIMTEPYVQELAEKLELIMKKNLV